MIASRIGQSIDPRHTTLKWQRVPLEYSFLTTTITKSTFSASSPSLRPGVAHMVYEKSRLSDHGLSDIETAVIIHVES